MASLKEILSKKTDDQLKYYIDNVDKHTDDGVLAALAELRYRNVDLPEHIVETVDQRLKERANLNNGHKVWDKFLVADQLAPECYSQKAIYIFSILFSVFFGSFMLAENLNEFGKPRWPAILFGLGYTLLTMILGMYISIGLPYTYIANALGVTLMYAVFWNKQIGKKTPYRAKPVWKPIFYGIALTVALFFGFIYLFTTPI